MKDTGPLVASRTLGAGLFPLLLASFTLEVSPWWLPVSSLTAGACQPLQAGSHTGFSPVTDRAAWEVQMGTGMFSLHITLYVLIHLTALE